MKKLEAHQRIAGIQQVSFEKYPTEKPQDLSRVNLQQSTPNQPITA